MVRLRLPQSMGKSSFVYVSLLIAATFLSGCGTMPGQAPLTDAEITQIVMSSNNGEIRQGELATSRASSEAVRDFGRTLVSDHSAANQRTTALAERSGITPLATDLTRKLEANTERSLETLGTWRGSGFDRSFLDTQVQFYQWLLDTIDANLLPSVSNPALKEELEAQRGSVAVHLAHAQQLRSSL